MLPSIRKTPDTSEKLAILSRDSRFDLACACATSAEEHRRRGKDQKWIYPVVLPNGGTTYLFKTLLSNVCTNDCAYCPLRAGAEAERCSLTPEEAAKAFRSYYQSGQVSGLFLSSGVIGTPDATMERINRTAMILRGERFKGYIHLKIIPGSSEAAIRHALSLATTVSLNIETAGEENFRQLSVKKNYRRDILDSIQLISRLTAKGARFEGIKQTTQFVVGASRETDKQIVKYSWKLYQELSLSRVYFSAYQRGAGAPDLPGESSAAESGELLTREHRLYQVDWLIRKYGFRAEEIPFGANGNLSLATDPKEMWARTHPEFFPVDLNRDERWRVLRVPGLGETATERILGLRANGSRLKSLADIGRFTKTLAKASPYVTFS
jgi:predicted DNA-binding helix-hairpin-helix protein